MFITDYHLICNLFIFPVITIIDFLEKEIHTCDHKQMQT